MNHPRIDLDRYIVPLFSSLPLQFQHKCCHCGDYKAGPSTYPRPPTVGTAANLFAGSLSGA